MPRRNGALVAAVVAVASIVFYNPRLDAQLTRDSPWQWADPPASTIEIPADGAERQQRQTRIEPAIAGGLSAVLPGAGQFYNGQNAKGILMLAGFTSAIVVGMTAGFDSDIVCRPDGDSPLGPRLCVTDSGPSGRFWIGLGGAAGLYAWSILDAIAGANRSRGPAKGGEREADVQLAPRRLQDGTLAFAAGIRVRR